MDLYGTYPALLGLSSSAGFIQLCWVYPALLGSVSQLDLWSEKGGVDMHKPTTPAGYGGRILTGSFSSSLGHAVQEILEGYLAFDRLGLSVMPYIAAWRTDQAGIWYEFVSDRFLAMFRANHTTIAETFCRAVISRHRYRQTDIYPNIVEKKLDRHDLDNRRQVLRRQTTEEGVMQAIYHVRLPDGAKAWLKDWASVTNYPQDGLCLSPGYLCDVTLEMEHQDHLDSMSTTVNRDKSLLVAAERSAALGQISAKIFHEIRNPVLAIGALARRVSKGDPDSANTRLVEVIAREAERLEKVVDNLFQFTSEIDLNRQATDPKVLIKDVIDLLKSDLDRQHIEINMTVDAKLPIIHIDCQQIQLALVHIVKNSIEAMPTGGEIIIATRKQGDHLLITIKDTGPGVADGHRHRLSEPFFTTKVYGTGLGLSLAEKAIRLHQGTLTFCEAAEGGTESHIRLPFVPGNTDD